MLDSKVQALICCGWRCGYEKHGSYNLVVGGGATASGGMKR